MLPGRILLCAALCTTSALGGEQEAEHPLIPVLEMGHEALRRIDGQVKDYTCWLVMRERIDDRLSDYANAFVKVRHRQVHKGEVPVPFSVYLRFTRPAKIQGREVIYVQGRNKGKLIARNGGSRFEHVTVAIDPRSEMAMRQRRYPVTELGIRNLIQRLIESGRQELQFRDIDVKHFNHAKINGRACRAIQLLHPVRREHSRYQLVRLFIDDKLNLPIRFASWDWPQKEGGKPRLLEEYTYVGLKLNVGLTDRDFDHRNENYRFRKDFKP